MANPDSMKNGYKLYIDSTSPSKDGNGYEITCTLRKTGSYGSFGNYSTNWWIEIDGVRRSGSLGSFSDSTSTIGTYTRTVPVTPGAAAKTITLEGFWDSQHGSIGSGNPSKTVKLPRIPYPAPSTPGTPSVNSSSAGTFSASWSKPAGTVSGYNGRYRVNGGSWVSFTASGTSYSKSGLTPGASVDVQIQAKNADATSGWSGTGSTTMKATAPSAPATPAVVSNAAGAFTATWSAPSSNGGKPIAGYDLRFRVNGGSWTTVTGVSSGYTRTGLTPGGTVEVQVLAYNADADSAWSATRSIVMNAAAPGAPGAPTVTSTAAGAFTASWAAPSSNGGKPITGYDLRYRVDGGAWTTVTGITSPRTVTGLIPGGDVDVQVLANNADAKGSYSGSGSATMKAAAPGVPVLLPLASPSPGEVLVAWTAPLTGGKPITKYEVQYATNAAFSGAQTISTTGLTVTITTTPGVTLWVRIRAVNEDATGAWSDAVSILVLSGLWVSDGTALAAALGVLASDGSTFSSATVYYSDGNTLQPAR